MNKPVCVALANISSLKMKHYSWQNWTDLTLAMARDMAAVDATLDLIVPIHSVTVRLSIPVSLLMVLCLTLKIVPVLQKSALLMV
jgi:hypothetical protein